VLERALPARSDPSWGSSESGKFIGARRWACRLA
jgi:hypothetical protein